MSERPFRRAPIGAAVIALMASGASHAQWKVEPGVQLRELYSDNVALQADTRSSGQFVTELTPSLAILHTGPRLTLTSNFHLSAYAYSGERPAGTNRSQRQAQVGAQATLVDDLLYFNGQGMSGQRPVSPFGQRAGNDYSSVNQDQVSTYSLSPYLQHRFHEGTSALLRFSRDHVNMATTGVGSSGSDNILFSLDSDPLRHRLSWTLKYNRQNVSGARVQDSSNEQAMATLRYRVAQPLSLRIGAGYDKYDFAPLGGTTEGRSWNAGFSWTPSARTSLDASYGQRFVGPVKSLLAVHRSRNTVWNIGYDDTVTTSRDNFLLPATANTVTMLDQLFASRIADPALRRQAVEDYVRLTGLPSSLADSINYFSNRYYLQKHLHASLALNGAHSSALLSLYRMRRDALSTRQSDSVLLGGAPSAINDNTVQRGASLTLTYRLSARSAAALVLDASRSESLSSIFATHGDIGRFTLTHLLSRNLTASLEARRTAGSLGHGNYVEHSLSAALSYLK